MELRVGTSGYSYTGWKGYFYPEKIKPADMLSYYAAQLPSVEINNTFYRMPRRNVLETWRDQVPERFRFVLKASRRITHFKRLRDAGEETGYVLASSEVLGDRLGVLLFQLPPNLKADLDLLRGFLELIPEGRRVAFEFRHPSWSDDAVHAVLQARNAALVLSDTGDREPSSIVATADWGYLRLRREDYDEEALQAWFAGVQGQDWREAYVFFKHEDQGAGPRMAGRFLELAGAGG